MSLGLFRRIAAAIENHDGYFRQKRNAIGDLGLSPYQKITAALRMITYGVPADFLDDCLAIAESTIIESLRHFVKSRYSDLWPGVLASTQ
jgi:class 3 adenylate cyclase